MSPRLTYLEVTRCYLKARHVMITVETFPCRPDKLCVLLSYCLAIYCNLS